MSESTQSFFERFTAPFGQMMAEQSTYSDAMRAQMKQVREQNMHMMRTSMEDMMTLTRAGVTYQTELMSEMQQISMDAMKQSMTWMKRDA